ncbi:SDR family NAD(P)-dependent oxidoreductase [Pelagibius sp.]|uniref:SDR family NAD(P)-dependent oxidoreductase n=1 Tax=Pelagibius sp. TaxID=1931238 RepID=UPI00262B7257|nr:SDR family oxidoreductase [Pelagibius sp.]
MSERVVLVTGASSGIGAATCRRLAGPGLAILAHARGGSDGAKRPALQALVEELRTAGAEAEAAFADLAEGGAAALVDQAIARFGRLDQVVSNAGFAQPTPVGDADRAAFDRSLETMAGAFFDLITAARGQLEASPRGRVVAVSSFVVHRAPGGRIFPVTAAAKGAIEGLARTFAAEVAGRGVTVNCVAPGFTRKEATGHSAMSEEAWRAAAALTPSGRIAEPDDIAAAIEFLLSDDAAHITGQTLHVDGGLSLG